MKVKELITELLEMDMSSDIMVSTSEPHTDGNIKSQGYLFEIDRVNQFNAKTVELIFTDWRKTSTRKGTAV